MEHTHLTHSFLINKESRPTSDNCRTPLTIEHVSFHCPKYKTAHHILNNPTSIEEAFNHNNTANIFKFLEHIDLANKI